MDAAQKLFPALGYDGTSIQLIAAEARVTKITIYRHFENKEALFLAALHGFCEELPTPASVVSEQQGSLRTRLLAIARNLLGLATGSLILRVHGMLSPRRESAAAAAEDLWTARFQPYHQELQQFLRREQETGVLDMTDSAAASTHFLSLITGEPVVRLFFTGIPFRKEADADCHVRAAVDIFLRAYGSRHGPGPMPATKGASVTTDVPHTARTPAAG